MEEINLNYADATGVVLSSHLRGILAGRNRLDGPAKVVGKEDLPGIFLGGEVPANLATGSDRAVGEGKAELG